MTAIIIIAILIIAILVLLVSCIKIVPQSMVFVVERLGSYYQTWENGLHFKVPFLDSEQTLPKEILLYDMVL